MFVEKNNQKNVSSDLGKVINQCERNRVEIEALTKRLEKVAMISQALWELVREETDLKDDDILQKIEEVDMRNGRIDERMMPKIFECPSCQRKVNTKQPACMYCGAKIAHEKEHVFE